MSEPIVIRGQSWKRDPQYGWVNDEDDPAWVTEADMLDEIQRLRDQRDDALMRAERFALKAETLLKPETPSPSPRSAQHDGGDGHE